MFDVIIIGAGASGMTAAICATDEDINYKLVKKNIGYPKKKVLLLEKNKKIGKKIYATGNGKCNISNSYFDLDCYNSENEFFPFKIVGFDDYKKVNDFFYELGVATISENGYFYPLSKQASSVVWAFSDRIKKDGIEVHTGETVTDIRKINDTDEQASTYKITTDKGEYLTKRVVLSCGGLAAPSLGGSEKGYELLEKLNVPVIKPKPALCKLICDEDIHELSGVRAKAGVTLLDKNGNELTKYEKGEVQFTENKISGIAIFNISHMASEMLSKGEGIVLNISFIPDLGFEDIARFMSVFKKNNPDRNLLACLNGILNEKISTYILERLKLSNMKMRDVNNKIIVSITEEIKFLKFNIVSTSDFSESQVTMGGVDTSFLNPQDMSLKMYENLYVTGELVDVNGKCGGYNLMWAVLTGMKAGFSIYNDTNK